MLSRRVLARVLCTVMAAVVASALESALRGNGRAAAARLAPAPWSPAPAFALAETTTLPGTRRDLDLLVSAGANDPATRIPITVFHGTRPGRVLALTAGVHGFEYVPILAAQRLLDRIDPNSLAGTVLLVRIAHVAAFEGRVPFVNPFDRKNLNRVFPGQADGTQAERIAAALSTHVIARADWHVELHGGDGAEWLEAFVGAYGGPLADAQYADARRMALAFGFRNVVKYSMHTQAQVDQGRSLNRQAVAAGKPTVLVEIGENGRRDQAWVAALVSGVENLLRTMGMAPGPVRPPRRDTRWLDDTVGVSATKTGIFTPTSTVGRFVRRGDALGTIRDYEGRLVETVASPIDGYVLYGIAGPPVVAGDAVATIGKPARKPL